MRRHRVFMCLAAILSVLFNVRLANAQVLISDGETTVYDGFNSPTENVELRNGPAGVGDPTTLEVQAGAIIPESGAGISIELFENSLLNFDGGQSLGSVRANDSSQASITEGSIADDVIALGNSVVSISGGTISDDLIVNDSATVYLSSSTFDDIIMGGNSTVVMTGGFLDEPRISGSALFQFSGGRIDDLIGLVSNSRVEISGTALVDDDLFFAGDLITMSGGRVDDEFWIGTSDEGATLSTGTRGVITGGQVLDDLNVVSDAVLDVYDIELADSIDSSDTSVTNVYGGTVEGSVSPTDSSVVNIYGGQFPNVFSDGEQLLAIGGTLNVFGGVFGQAGVDDGGNAGATLGGTLNYSGGLIAGIDTGDAPTATFSALINAQVNLSDSVFARLVLEAGNNGVLNASGYQAETVDVRAIANGTVNLLGSGADELTITVELAGIVNLKGGDFGDIDATLLSEGVLNVFGHSFKFNNVPLEDVDAVFGTGGYIESTGEIRFVSGNLSGLLRNGDPFEMSFTRFAVQGARLFVTIVPEPGTCSLCLFSALLLVGRPRS